MRQSLFMAVLALLLGAGLGALAPAAAAAEIEVSAVEAGGVSAALLRPAKPRASIILLTGGPGRVEVLSNGDVGRGRINQLVRTREDYARRGFAVLVPDVGFDLGALVAYMGRIKRPVVVVGTSRGTQRAARGLAGGARPDKLVLTSGFLSDASGGRENVIAILGDPALLPPTLVVHHRQDGCKLTQPAGVEPFLAWAHGKARAQWLSGGAPEGDPCESLSAHGFMGLDEQVVSIVSGFAGR